MFSWTLRLKEKLTFLSKTFSVLSVSKNTKLYEETKLCTFQYYPLVSIKWFQMWKVHLKTCIYFNFQKFLSKE